MQDCTILIVEDESITAMFLKKMLTNRGYNVMQCVTTGEEALDYIEQHKPSLIIMDIRLAGEMDGIETVKKLRTEPVYPAQVIFSTGYTDQIFKDEAMMLQPLGFLTKPINMSEVTNLIDSFFVKCAE